MDFDLLESWYLMCLLKQGVCYKINTKMKYNTHTHNAHNILALDSRILCCNIIRPFDYKKPAKHIKLVFVSNTNNKVMNLLTLWQR